MINIKKISVLFMALVLILSVKTNAVKAGEVDTESFVTEEMCDASYWIQLAGENAKNVWMTKDQIKNFNLSALYTKDSKMFDVTNMDDEYNAEDLKNSLVKSILGEAPKNNIYVNGVLTDTKAYYATLTALIQNTGWNGTREPLYAVAVSQTQIKNIPVMDFIGYEMTDSDDEAVLSALRVNEPFLVKQKATIGGMDFYWGYSNNVSGWVCGTDIAFCDSKSNWYDMWQVDIENKDFIVVTQNYYTLPESVYTPASSGLKLTMGTTLKLVPRDERPKSVGVRGYYNNYAVYIPARGADGKCIKQVALVPQNASVSVGFLPMTSENIIQIAFTALGDTYGWGGMLDAMDCSLFTRNIYKCFGLEMPRNTNSQKTVPGTCFDLTGYKADEKAAVIASLAPGVPLYMSGHTMIYIGTAYGNNYVISAAGAFSEGVGELKVVSQNSVVINSLKVRRGSGASWLDSLNSAVVPSGI